MSAFAKGWPKGLSTARPVRSVTAVKRSSRDIRTANRYQVLRHVIAEHPVSRSALAMRTGLSLATVATLTGELLALGLLTEAGHEDSAGGRPRALVAPDAGGGALVGVDVAETYVRAEVYDLAFGVLATAQEQLRPGERAPGEVVGRIASSVERALDASGAEGDQVLGVGVSMPGMVDREGGVSVYAANWGWHDVPLLRLLGERLPHPLHLDNPLRACAVAELWFGAARGCEDSVVVNLGTGVGAGLVLGGELHRGKDNSAGEWGHTPLVLDGHPCLCGDRGCVEAYVGAHGIMRALRELAPGSPLHHPDDQTATIEALGRAAADGDPVAVRVVAGTGRLLGAALAGLVNLLNPEVVVLSSWVASALGQQLLDAVRATVAERALARPLSGTSIVLCPLSSDPVSLGAATFALEGHLAAPRNRTRRRRNSAHTPQTPQHSRTARTP
ncbi:ROK family transcriptional regulator [Streptomyces daliensis]